MATLTTAGVNLIQQALNSTSTNTTVTNGGYYVGNDNYTWTYPNMGTTTTWSTTPFVVNPPVDPGPSNEEVDEAIRSIRRSIERRNG